MKLILKKEVKVTLASACAILCKARFPEIYSKDELSEILEGSSFRDFIPCISVRIKSIEEEGEIDKLAFSGEYDTYINVNNFKQVYHYFAELNFENIREEDL